MINKNNSRKDRVLVTGSTGFIGSHLVEALLEKNYRVFCLLRPTSDPKWLKNLGVNFLKGNYDNQESLNLAVKRMDLIFHVGAVINALDWQTFYKANVGSTIKLLEACMQTNPTLKKFIFVSSIAAVGPARNKISLKENDRCFPISLYGQSKYLAEKAVTRFFKKLPIVIIRPTNILGVRQKELYNILKLASKGLIPMLGSKEKQTTICFIQDLIRALISAAENEKVRSQVFFVADDKYYSWREMLDIIIREMNPPVILKIPQPVLLMIAYIAETIARITRSTPFISSRSLHNIRRHDWLHDISSIKKELGFSPRIDFKNGIRNIIKWYKDNQLL